MDDLLRFAKRADAEATRRQTSLFSQLPVTHAPALRLKPSDPASSNQRGHWERELLGLYITDHPLRQLRPELERVSQPLATLRERSGRRVTVAGLITKSKRITTRTNDRMAFIRLEDLSGSIEVVVFPNLFRDSAELWQDDTIVVVEGQLTHRDGDWKILANTVKRFSPDDIGPAPIRILVALESATSSTFDQLKRLFQDYPGERAVELVVRKGPQERRIPTKHTITFTPELRAELETLLGTCILESE